MKEFAPEGSKFFPFSVDPFSKGRSETILTELSPLKVYACSNSIAIPLASQRICPKMKKKKKKKKKDICS